MTLPIYGSERIEYDDTYHPTVFNQRQYYNLQNQSWGIPRKNDENHTRDPISIYRTDLGYYPSNADTVWIGLQFKPISGSQPPREVIYTNIYKEATGTELKAAKGYFIIDALRRGQSRVDAYNANKTKHPELNGGGALTTVQDYTPGGATVVAEFAGRVFYSGFSGTVVDGDIRSPNLSNFVLFTQLVKNRKDLVKCYQDGDPTSRDGNDLVDTDGGFIRLSGAESIIGMVNLGGFLAVIASNGVWAISGGSDYGFTATNYKADKISSYGGIAKDSIIEDGGRAFYWSEDGIYVIAKDQFGALTVTSITEKTIQKYYESIPNTSKEQTVAVYDSVNKTIRWIYNIGTRFSSTSRMYELVLNLSINAFYKNRIYNSTGNNVEVISAFSSVKFNNTATLEDVVASGDPVTVEFEQVVIPDVSKANALQATRYLCFIKDGDTYSYTFGYYNDNRFRDWLQVAPVDAKAFLLTGAITGGDSSVAKQAPYLTMHFRRTEQGVIDGQPDKQSSCLTRFQWDWANSIISNKWSALMEAYRYRKALFITGPTDTYDNGHDLVTSKSKVRGRGKAFSLYLETAPLKDCQIVGWNININGNQVT